MEATQYAGRQLTESDYALRSLSVGDDLDRLVSRSSLNLAALRREVSEWHERLARVQAIMKEEQRRTRGTIQQLLTGLLEHPPLVEDIAGTLMMAAGHGVAREVLLNVNVAGNVLAAYLEQQEKTLGAESPNTKGRIRAARQELARYHDIAQSAERLLKQDAHLDYESEQRARLEISAYTRRQRELGQLESQLVDPAVYVPRSEAEHLKHLVLSALIGGK